MSDTTSGIKTIKKALARNAIMNLVGECAPMVVAVFAIPILIKGLGTDRFGILTIAWVFVGYFNLFDMGLGRALTKLIAEKMGKGQFGDIPRLTWTALALMGGLGMFGVIAVILLTPWLVNSVLNIPDFLRDDSRRAFYLLALSIPVVIITAGLRGILEAHLRFDIIVGIRIPLGFFTFLGPLAVLPFSKSLVAIVAVLVAGRVVAALFHLIYCLRVIPALKKDVRGTRTMVKPLLSYGGWLTVSNVVGPALTYADRFFIAGMISIGAVAYYTTPYEVISKLLIIPIAILAVMFPAFSKAFAQDALHVRHLYYRTAIYLSFIMVPLVALIILFSEQVLALWISPDFAHKSVAVAQLLSIGVLINSFGYIPYSVIQAAGRPDITAKIHLCELPLYLAYLKFLLPIYGIKGAALAWIIRASISTVVLAFVANRVISHPAARDRTPRIGWRMLNLRGKPRSTSDD